jgi:hypothetical protein
VKKALWESVEAGNACKVCVTVTYEWGKERVYVCVCGAGCIQSSMKKVVWKYVEAVYVRMLVGQ